jgi:hypothetical protein
MSASSKTLEGAKFGIEMDSTVADIETLALSADANVMI